MKPFTIISILLTSSVAISANPLVKSSNSAALVKGFSSPKPPSVPNSSLPFSPAETSPQQNKVEPSNPGLELGIPANSKPEFGQESSSFEETSKSTQPGVYGVPSKETKESKGKAEEQTKEEPKETKPVKEKETKETKEKETKKSNEVDGTSTEEKDCSTKLMATAPTRKPKNKKPDPLDPKYTMFYKDSHSDKTSSSTPAAAPGTGYEINRPESKEEVSRPGSKDEVTDKKPKVDTNIVANSAINAHDLTVFTVVAGVTLSAIGALW
ncbi:hypothetical protein HDU97_002065 [Phlyctochytrium planicorne]|nr:hypothetical protein HDU97_002065 [Phlyctochytrium planicorne]